MFSTAGNLEGEPIDREMVIGCLECMLLTTCMDLGKKDMTEDGMALKAAKVRGEREALEAAIKVVKGIPIMHTPDGKILKRSYYPVIRVEDLADHSVRQVGGNSHDALVIRNWSDGGTYIVYENLQNCESTDGGCYRFAGEKIFPDDEEDFFEKRVEFREVWEECGPIGKPEKDEDDDGTVHCKDCAVPHNTYTGCPELGGIVPAKNWSCAAGIKKDDERKVCHCWHLEHDYLRNLYGVCWGTKEVEECTCGGDTTKCDFYPDKRTADRRRE